MTDAEKVAYLLGIMRGVQDIQEGYVIKTILVNAIKKIEE